MSVKFNRSAAGSGVEVHCRAENGKLLLQWSFQLKRDTAGTDSCGAGDDGAVIRLRLWDGQEKMVLECVQCSEEEERLESVLLHPCLWQGTEHPYLYRLEAQIVTRSGEITDTLVRMQPFYTLTGNLKEGISLNGQPFLPRAVRYGQPEECRRGGGLCGSRPEECGGAQERRMEQDLRKLLEMGANSIVREENGWEEGLLRQCCERLGLLLWEEEQVSTVGWRELPRCYEMGQEEAPVLFGKDGEPCSLYYRYRAAWGRTPFVYLVPESVHRQENGSFTATVYSSCKRVALYSDGNLQEFQPGEEEFVFREIQSAGPCLMLTAEAEECTQSLSIHKTFTKLSPFHDI